MQADLVITYTSGGKKGTTTVSDVNPDVENNKLLALATALMRLTTAELLSARKQSTETL